MARVPVLSSRLGLSAALDGNHGRKHQRTGSGTHPSPPELAAGVHREETPPPLSHILLEFTMDLVEEFPMPFREYKVIDVGVTKTPPADFAQDHVRNLRGARGGKLPAQMDRSDV